VFDTAAPVVIRRTNVIADGDQVFAEWTTRATSKSGGTYANNCGAVFTVRDGLIVAVREYADTTTPVGCCSRRDQSSAAGQEPSATNVNHPYSKQSNTLGDEIDTLCFDASCPS
jgi:hypothetical protein